MNDEALDPDVLTIKELAVKIRCSRAHAANVLNGKVPGVPALPHIQVGRRKLIRRRSLEQWLDEIERGGDGKC